MLILNGLNIMWFSISNDWILLLNKYVIAIIVPKRIYQNHLQNLNYEKCLLLIPVGEDNTYFLYVQPFGWDPLMVRHNFSFVMILKKALEIIFYYSSQKMNDPLDHQRSSQWQGYGELVTRE